MRYEFLVETLYGLTPVNANVGISTISFVLLCALCG